MFVRRSLVEFEAEPDPLTITPDVEPALKLPGRPSAARLTVSPIPLLTVLATVATPFKVLVRNSRLRPSPLGAQLDSQA